MGQLTQQAVASSVVVPAGLAEEKWLMGQLTQQAVASSVVVPAVASSVVVPAGVTVVPAVYLLVWQRLLYLRVALLDLSLFPVEVLWALWYDVGERECESDRDRAVEVYRT